MHNKQYQGEKMKKCCIVYNEDKSLARELYHKSLEYFVMHDITVIDEKDAQNADFVVIIGGDGTILHHFYKFLVKKDIPVIGINAGKLGFLAEISPDEMYDVYDSLLTGEYITEHRHILEVTVAGETYLALNEVCITKSNVIGKLLSVELTSKHGKNGNICTYRGDGVIVATPSGSTAYSLSSGGPIVKTDLKLLLITPIAPHNLNSRPIVIDGREELVAQIVDDTRDGYVTIDGQISENIGKNEKVNIKYSEQKINFVVSSERNYYDILREKLKWGDKLC